MIPEFGRGLEAGIGSGRFAAPPGIGDGIDPSRPLIAMAKDRGIEVIQGAGSICRTGRGASISCSR